MAQPSNGICLLFFTTSKVYRILIMPVNTHYQQIHILRGKNVYTNCEYSCIEN